MESEQTAELAAALAKAQAAMRPAIINKVNPHFKNKYADLAAVLDAIRKPLADNGLSITQTPELGINGFVLVTKLRHMSGQWVGCEYPLPSGAKPQEIGSALTYARRYSLSAIACIAADEDDDAEAATDRKESPIKQVVLAAPVDPETGEASPHLIKAADETVWCQLFVAAITAAQSELELDQWMFANKEALETLESAAPRFHVAIKKRLSDKQKSFKGKAA